MHRKLKAQQAQIGLPPTPGKGNVKPPMANRTPKTMPGAKKIKDTLDLDDDSGDERIAAAQAKAA